MYIYIYGVHWVDMQVLSFGGRHSNTFSSKTTVIALLFDCPLTL